MRHVVNFSTGVASAEVARTLVALAVLPLTNVAIWHGFRGRFEVGDGLMALAAILGTFSNILWGDWRSAAFCAVTAAWFGWCWWRRRKDRRRSLQRAGYKTRAVLARLARKAREAAQPRPLLRPVPGGAG